MKEMVGGCCVCSDDRGWSENPLVYCDGQSCAVAVHQACYGIVTVPSGPWYCRKCESQERSARVRCELCPSRDGALKRTDNQGWAHVVCALYIPEVRFGNVTTMEPIILQLIPQERYNKTCYICQEVGKGSRANVGACMQCNKSGCKQQFHVTCAQQLGLLCEEAGNYLDNVKYCGYCQHHYSKLKKGGNVKTIPPYKPISHEANSSDGQSSPEKEMEPPSTQPHSSASASGSSGTGGSGSGTGGGSSSSSGLKSSSRLSGEPNVGGSSSTSSSSSSSSSKQRKSSSASKSSSGSSSNPSLSSSSSSIQTTGGGGSSSGGPGMSSSSSMSALSSTASSSASSGVSSLSGSGSIDDRRASNSSSGIGSSGATGSVSSSGSSSKSSSGSSGGTGGSGNSSSTSKEKDKYSKSRDKSSKSSKSSSSSGGNSGSSGGSAGNFNNSTSTSNSAVGGSSTQSKDGDMGSAPGSSTGSLGALGSSSSSQSLSQSGYSSTAGGGSNTSGSGGTNSSNKHHSDKSDKGSTSQGGSVASSGSASAGRAASLSPPSTLIIKAPLDHSGSSGKEQLSKEAIAKISTSSNFTETIVVNSDSMYNHVGSAGNTGSTSVIESGKLAMGSGSGGGSSGSYGGSNTGSTTGSTSGGKKRKADARSTPTSTAGTSEMESNRDLIRDVAVSLVPLSLNKNDHIDPSSIVGHEKNVKKAKTETSSSLQHPATAAAAGTVPAPEPNLQNVAPNLIQSTHTSSIISSSSSTGKHQQQQQQQQQHQQQTPHSPQQPSSHTPSLVVSVPLSTATVPGVNLPASNSSNSSSSNVNHSASLSSSNSSNSTPNIVSPAQLGANNSSAGTGNSSNIGNAGGNLYQQLSHRAGDQLMNATTNRSSPVIQQQTTAQNIIQSSSSTSAAGSSSSSTPIGHHHLERQSPSMRSSPAGLATGGANVITSLHHSQSQQSDLLSPAGSGPGGGSVLQSISPVPMSTIQRTSSPSTLLGGDNSNSSSGGLKFSYEKQPPTTNARIAALQEEESSTGRRSRYGTPEMIVSSGAPYSMSSTLTASSSSSSSLYGTAGGGGGGLKFSYEAQPTNPLAAVSTASMLGNSGTSSVIAVPQVKDSPPSSPGSDAGGPSGTTIVSGRGTKRNRKMSSNAGPGPASTATGTGPTIVPASIVAGGAINDAKDGKLFQNGGSSAVGGGSIVSATHMLGNQLNPSSSVAQKMSDQLSMEIEAHSYVPGPIDAGPSLMGPQFPGKNRTNNPQPVMPVGGGGNSLSSMLTGGGTATANGNTPQSLEQLLERQWEQGSQFLMEQAQHFDIASLLSCLHQLRSENIRLEEHVNNLVARRDHLLAVNARLAIPLNPTAALGGVGIIGGSGGSGPGGGGGSVGGAGIGPTQGQFNNIHGNGPIDANVITNAATISSRSGRGQHGQNQPPAQGPASHFGSGAGSNAGGLPQENGIDFRHTNSSHSATNSASISEKPNTIYVNF